MAKGQTNPRWHFECIHLKDSCKFSAKRQKTRLTYIYVVSHRVLLIKAFERETWWQNIYFNNKITVYSDDFTKTLWNLLELSFLEIKYPNSPMTICKQIVSVAHLVMFQ